MRPHPCIHPRCAVTVGGTVLACSPHWWDLPQALRHEVTSSYRQRAQNPRRHIDAVAAASRWFRANLAAPPSAVAAS